MFYRIKKGFRGLLAKGQELSEEQDKGELKVVKSKKKSESKKETEAKEEKADNKE